MIIRRSVLFTAISCLALTPTVHQPVAAQGRRTPAPPPSKPTIYDPDPLTCDPTTIRTAFQRHLAPFEGQEEKVLAHLRNVQWSMTQKSIQRCVSRGLLDEASAEELQAELLGSAGSSDQTPGLSTRP